MRKSSPILMPGAGIQMLDRQLSYISLFLLLFLAILEGYAADHLWLIVSLVLAWSVATIAFFSGWLTLDGRLASTVVGTIVLGLGGWVPALLLLIFFLSSSLLTRPVSFVAGGAPLQSESKNSPRRDGAQVWANGFWVSLLSIMWFIRVEPFWLLLAAVALAVSTADTWASELGRSTAGKTVRLNDFKQVPPGSEGGVSVIGTLAALGGAMLIALSFILLTGNLSLWHFFLISFCGLTGCMADSYLGATLEQAQEHRMARFIDLQGNLSQGSNFINWATTGVGVLLAALLIQLFR